MSGGEIRRGEHRGVQYEIRPRTPCPGIGWRVGTRDSSGAFYDGCDDHPEGAYAWAESAVKLYIDKRQAEPVATARVDRALPLSYYCEISEENRLRRELHEAGAIITRERLQPFTDGTSKVQLHVQFASGRCVFFTPQSDAAIQQQRDAGRHLTPYQYTVL